MVFERDARQVAAVRDVDDVPAPLADHLGHGREHAGPVGHLDREANETSRTGECPQQRRRQHAEIDVAAGEHDHHVAVAEALRELDERGEPGRARAFDDGLLDLRRQRDRGLDVLLADDEQIVDERADDLARQRARRS